MKYEDLIENAVSLEVAYDRIKNNISRKYIWVAVKNKQGSYLELGGCFDKKIEFRASIPLYEDKKIILYENGYIIVDYTLYNDYDNYYKGTIAYPNFYGKHTMTTEELLKFLDEKDFRIYKPKMIEKEIIVYKTVKNIEL